MSNMKIGFSYMWPLGSWKSQRKQFLGDELYGRSLRKELLKSPEVTYCELFNQEPPFPLDIVVYWNDTPPNPKFARKSILYFQNSWPEGSDKKLKEFHQRNYDGFIFMSKKLLGFHEKLGYSGIYLSSAADAELMRPVKPVKKYMFEVAYVGSDIKGRERTMKYIYPAVKFNFGLYGNWNRKLWFIYKYRRIFRKISCGRLPLEDTPLLYSSAKIILNCTAADHAQWDTLTGRIYDVLACNGFLISDFAPGTEKEIGECMIVSKGGLDLGRKIEYYLDHGKERKKIASRGREAILKGHTMKDRAKTMLEYFKKILKEE